MTKKACITGVTGQTGSYLAEVLLEQGYEVHGLVRRSSSFNTERIDHIYNDVRLTYGDLSDYSSIANWVRIVQPNEFYNLGAMSHVRVSFDIPEYTMDIGATGVIRCLEALCQFSPHTHFVQASTSEMFGSVPPPHSEKTVLHPRSPYGAAKIAGFWSTVNYRESGKLFAANSMSFNHESPRRGETFVTRKITRAATRIKLGLQEKLVLGNLDAKRDWNHAKDVARAIHMMATAPQADDWVVASGEMHSVRDFLTLVFEKLDLDWEEFVDFDPRYLRPAEVDALCGDSTKIRTELGWKPEYTFDQLVDEMVESDLKLAHREKKLQEVT
jgi:GDPmannose 4,6-dehydratase